MPRRSCTSVACEEMNALTHLMRAIKAPIKAVIGLLLVVVGMCGKSDKNDRF